MENMYQEIRKKLKKFLSFFTNCSITLIFRDLDVK